MGGSECYGGSQEKVRGKLNYIENIKPPGEPGIILLPDVKIKRLAFTKKRYLERQEEDKNQIFKYNIKNCLMMFLLKM